MFNFESFLYPEEIKIGLIVKSERTGIIYRIVHISPSGTVRLFSIKEDYPGTGSLRGSLAISTAAILSRFKKVHSAEYIIM